MCRSYAAGLVMMACREASGPWLRFLFTDNDVANIVSIPICKTYLLTHNVQQSYGHYPSNPPPLSFISFQPNEMHPSHVR